jgi:hypothetical protein
MSKEFTAKQKEIVARKLGYDGPMQGFDEFLQSSPALAMKYGMIADKYMAKGGMVKKYQAGGDVQFNVDTSSTAQQKADEYARLLKAGYTNDQIRSAAETKFGKQTDQDWTTLTNLSGTTYNPNAALSQLAKNATSGGNTGVTPMPGGVTDNTFGIGAGASVTPKLNVTASSTPQQKADELVRLVNLGYTNDQIRAAADTQIGKQTDSDWSALWNMVGGGTNETARTMADGKKTINPNKTAADNQDLVAKVRERYPNYNPNKMTMDYDDADAYMDELINQQRNNSNTEEKKRITPADRSKEMANMPVGGSPTPGGSGGVKINIDPATATADQKAAEYNRLLSLGMTDAQIRAAAESQFGKQTADNWSELQRLSSTKGTTIPKATPGVEYGETGVPKAGAMQTVQAQQTATTTGQLKASDYKLSDVAPQAAVTTGTAQQATAAEAPKATSYEAVSATPGVQEALKDLTGAKGTVSDQAIAEAAQGTLSEGAIAGTVQKAEAAKVERVAPLTVTPEMMAQAVTTQDVGGIPQAQLQQSQYQSQIEAKQRQVTAEELVDIQKQNLQMETVQAVAATMDKLNSDAIAQAAQGNLFAGTAEAQQGRVEAEMTLRGQLSRYMEDFNDGTPAWAAGAMRAANAAMAARGLAGSSMAGAAILQAAMEAATPLAAADAKTFTDMGLTNLANRQQVALANAAAAQQMEIANLNARQQAALQNSANAFSLQSQNLSNQQATVLANAQLRAAAAEKNLDVRTQAAIVNAARIAEVNNINLNNSQQAMLARSAENLQVDLANLSSRQQTAIANAQIEASMKGQEMSNRQQVAIANASRVAEIAQANFSAEQNRVLTEAKFINDINVQDMSNRQAATLANAASVAAMDMANLNARQQTAVQNAKAFLEMDIANLSNEQQAQVIKAQELSQAATSDAAAKNAALQFNAANEQQAEQFAAKLATDVATFNTAQANSMTQFNKGQENSMAQFNTEMDARRDEFNTKNQIIIDQANAALLAQISTANTAQVNAANFENARAMNNMTLSQYNNEVQLYRDQVKMVYDSYERAEDRAAEMAVAVLSAEVRREAIDAQTSSALGNLIGSVLTGTKIGDSIIDAGKNFIKDLIGG